MLIREIQPKDDAQIEAIMRACFVEFELPFEGSSIEDEEVAQMYNGFKDSRAVYYVVEEEGKVVGGGGIKQLKGADAHICELQKMYFDPTARGKGYGRKIFNRCIEAAKNLGYKKCYLESASQLKDAIRLYEMNGFEHLNEPLGQTGHVICGVWMSREL